MDGLSECGEFLLVCGGDGDLIGLRVEVSEGVEEVSEERWVNVGDGIFIFWELVWSFDDGLGGGWIEEEREVESDGDKEWYGFCGRYCWVFVWDIGMGFVVYLLRNFI